MAHIFFFDIFPVSTLFENYIEYTKLMNDNWQPDQSGLELVLHLINTATSPSLTLQIQTQIYEVRQINL